MRKAGELINDFLRESKLANNRSYPLGTGANGVVFESDVPGNVIKQRIGSDEYDYNTNSQEADLQAIAAELDRSVNSVRGKALSLLRSGDIDAIPRQETTKGASKEDPLAELTDIATMGVEDIAEAIGKTARGVKTMLTRRGLSAADYDGASKKEKASA